MTLKTGASVTAGLVTVLLALTAVTLRTAFAVLVGFAMSLVVMLVGTAVLFADLARRLVRRHYGREVRWSDLFGVPPTPGARVMPPPTSGCPGGPASTTRG